MYSEILISIIIPVKNASFWLRSQYDAFANQTLFQASELIYLDSGSTDGTIDILKTLNVSIIHILPNEFNHGSTRNVGAEAARGKYVVMTVQDAIPSSNKWLEQLMAGFIDETVLGVCGQQVVPHDQDKNPIEWFRPVSKPGIKKVSFKNPEEYIRLRPEEKKKFCRWDDVNAIYRKEALLEIPFRHLNFGEDSQWAHDVLTRGFSIVYNSMAQVYHYHHEGYKYFYNRSIAVFYMHYKIFGYLPVPQSRLFKIKTTIRNLKILLQEQSVKYKDKVRWFKYNLMRQRAGTDALTDFVAAYKVGNDAVERLYKLHCEKAPMPRSIKS